MGHRRKQCVLYVFFLSFFFALFSYLFIYFLVSKLFCNGKPKKLPKKVELGALHQHGAEVQVLASIPCVGWILAGSYPSSPSPLKPTLLHILDHKHVQMSGLESCSCAFRGNQITFLPEYWGRWELRLFRGSSCWKENSLQ